MFKSWRNDKKKIKATFKLQFQATQVPRLKKPALTISLVPEDVGKTTFKLEKAAVEDGTCSWENSIFVNVKLIREQKTGIVHEKIYHFLVSSVSNNQSIRILLFLSLLLVLYNFYEFLQGSSKAGFLGEASIDFADFVAQNEALTVSLPLKFANSGSVLHITIQRMQGDTDQRHIEENGDPTLSQDGSFKDQFRNLLSDEEQNYAEDGQQNAVQNGSFRGSTTSSQDLASSQSNLGQNSEPNKVTVNPAMKKHVHRSSSTDWSLGSASDRSLLDLANSLEENLSTELHEDQDESSERLRSENATLRRQAEMSELELQTLRKQMAKENKRAQDLSRQIITLQEERDALETEIEQFESSQKCINRARSQLQADIEGKNALLEEIRRELEDEKDLNANLKMQLQKTQDSNSELIVAVRDLEGMLRQIDTEISQLSTKIKFSQNIEHVQGKYFISDMNETRDLQALPAREGKDRNSMNGICLLEQQITDLCGELEIQGQHREDLEMHLKQLTQDTEDFKQEKCGISFQLKQERIQGAKTRNELLESLATVKELESHVERLEEKLTQQTQELSESLDSIYELESQVKGLDKELEKQAREFEIDLDAMTQDKIEQEQRAIRAEEALRKTTCKNAVRAEQLQEEFQRLSVEMAGKIDENEKLVTKATTEADELRQQKRTLEEELLNACEELSSQIRSKENVIEQLSSELDEKSKHLTYAQKQEKEREREIQVLKAKIEILTVTNKQYEQESKFRDETQNATESHREKEMMTQRWTREQDELETKYSLAKKEAEKSQEELIVMKSMKDKKEKMVENLLSDVEGIRSQYSVLEHRLLEEKSEKENLRKQILELKDKQQKKEDKSTILEEKLNNGWNKSSDEKESTPTNNEFSLLPCDNEEISQLKDTVQHYKEGRTGGDFLQKKRKEGKASFERQMETFSEKGLEVSTFNLTELLAEMAVLKEKNISMENELKEMEERYSEISLKFAEVEGERQQLVMTVRNLKNHKKS
ncbi:myosin-8 isoform X2 [Tripterygium wilfordii]|uniref:myosin-8 isoform X2 n=1 Tax=Tripterygium wilfordii TaxID=458696 RepID=UPI0018F7E5C0|nr:myosin-8 isoform X2 [Tripterygium wilfordii]